jgi:glucosamine-6-phosphate deaminase
MKLHAFASPNEANAAAADMLVAWLTDPAVRTLMVAAGNTPLELYRRIAGRNLPLSKLEVFALDEYVGVPLDEPRNCANLLRKAVGEAWKVAHFHTISSLEEEAGKSIQQHEELIRQHGGLDALILGLGQNGHLGFNEPGSAADSTARVLDLEPVSVEANRQWFGGKFAPGRGVTVGMQTILDARRILVLAFGSHKREAVRSMVSGPRTPDCPASFLQTHPNAHLFADQSACAGLTQQ